MSKYSENLVCDLTAMHDISTQGDGPVPMYAFERPSRLFFVGVLEELEKRGLTRDQAIRVLKSKYVRWGLDKMEDQITELGREFAQTHLNDVDDVIGG